MAIFDFSEYQGTIDFGKVKGNTDLLILRVQAGSTHPDTKYASYVAGCKANGIPFGTYAYGKFVSVSDAQVEARDCFNRMDKATQFVVIDVESVSTTVASQLASATQAFIDYLHAQGVKKVGLYSGENFYKTHGLSAVKADFLWIANYGVNDGNQHAKPSIACDLWQYSSTATEAGVVGHVDVDTINGSKPLSYFTGINPLILRGCVDSPTQGQVIQNSDGKMTVSGWFLNGDGVGTIQILIDSQTQTYAWGTYGDAREDVLKAYPEYNNANSGYHCDIDLNKLGLGSHTLTLIGYSKDNKSSLKLPDVTFKVESTKLQIGSMATIKNSATNYVGGAVIADDMKGKQFKITSETDIDKYSYSTRQYTLDGVPAPLYEQDIVESGVYNGAPDTTPIPTPTPAPVVVAPTPAPTPVPPVVPVVEPTPIPVVPSPVVEPSVPTPKPVEAPSAPFTAPSVATMAQQIEDAVMKDPQLQKSLAQKVLDFFVSLFK
jgi:GH25 family lysozyme M1 (1,4-beta-N-acetylmuramidase)